MLELDVIVFVNRKINIQMLHYFQKNSSFRSPEFKPFCVPFVIVACCCCCSLNGLLAVTDEMTGACN